MSDQNPVNYQDVVPNILLAMSKVHGAIDAQTSNKLLEHLVYLRASQINGCAFCVKMHIADARKDGETQERLDRLIVWRHVDDFTDAEKAAFAWTEALTTLDASTDFTPLRGKLREHFSDEEIGVLTTNIAMINLWNRIQISGH